MPRLTASLWIAAEPERVFDTCQAPPVPLLPRGAPRLVILGEPGVVGSRYRWEFRRFGLQGRLDCVVIDSDPGARMAFRGQGNWVTEGGITLIPEKGGTRLLVQMEYRFPHPYRWLVPGGLIRLGVWHALHQIKAESERPMPAEALSPS